MRWISLPKNVQAVALGGLVSLFASPALASGEVGDHVNDLHAHLGDYEKEVVWLNEQVEGIVAGYESGGVEAAKPDRVVEIWEAVDFHAAIEVNYVPLYASIWQGLFAVKTAIEAEAPKAQVRAEQEKLAQVLWQSLGAVKLASQIQRNAPAAKAPDEPALTPSATLVEIGQRLDRVLAKYAEKLTEEATEIVHNTYLTRFEGVEGVLIERDAELVESLEIDFNVTLPKAMKDGASVDEVRTIVETMQGKLERARALLADAEKKRKPVF